MDGGLVMGAARNAVGIGDLPRILARAQNGVEVRVVGLKLLAQRIAFLLLCFLRIPLVCALLAQRHTCEILFKYFLHDLRDFFEHQRVIHETVRQHFVFLDAHRKAAVGLA